MVGGQESTRDERDGLLGDFARAVSSLSRGELGFPAPFDYPSSAALADNIDTGSIAERLFDVTALRQSAYEVVIRARSPQHPELPAREVINTVVPSEQMLIVLLETLLDELHDRTETEGNTTSG